MNSKNREQIVDLLNRYDNREIDNSGFSFEYEELFNFSLDLSGMTNMERRKLEEILRNVSRYGPEEYKINPVYIGDEDMTKWINELRMSI